MVKLRVRDTGNRWGEKTVKVDIREYTSYYVVTDHLGSPRVTVHDDGTTVAWQDYYPFGMTMPGRSYDASAPPDQSGFTGYQLEEEGGMDLYHAGARMYDPVIGRFTSQDRFKSKYPSFTPYQYAALNPITFIDVNGDSINVSRLANDVQSWLIGHLTQLTGVQLQVNDRGMLVPVEGAEVNENGTSKSAREDLTNAMSHKVTVNVEQRPANSDLPSRVMPNKTTIKLNLDQILYYEQNSEGVSSLTLGIGMTFLHELNHTAIGYGGGSVHVTPPSAVRVNSDQVLVRENLYRREIGSHMGFRHNYVYISQQNGRDLPRPYRYFGTGMKVYGKWQGGPYPYSDKNKP
jgi:RHS repeat-associated protein